MKRIALGLASLLLAGSVQAEVKVRETEDSIVVANAELQLAIHQQEDGVAIALSAKDGGEFIPLCRSCLLYTSPSPRD